MQQPLSIGVQPIIAAAHELKSPLTLITYIAQMLSDDTLALTEAEKAQYLQRLKLVSDRTLRLVQQLTLSYRLEDKQTPFSFAVEPVNAREVCESALHELTPYAREYNQQLQLRATNCPHMVVANREILRDIVINLVDNAIRHNAPGAAVDVRPQCRQGRVRVHVHDNGSNMPRTELSRLRTTLGTPQPLSNMAGSSGLGLYIVNQLAAAMGGALGLGRRGPGTTFFVDLLRSQQLSIW